ncbi:MAG: PadR family transcriptional regulator [Oscillospiraceae bacterium]
MLDPQMKRGLLENCVLAALCREDSYGYKIVKDLSGCVKISESTLYPILRRLESSGCLTEYSVAHNGRLRKFYRITPLGREQLAAFLEDWGEIAQMYEFIKGGSQHDEE